MPVETLAKHFPYKLSFLQETVYTLCKITLLSDYVYTQHVSALMLAIIRRVFTMLRVVIHLQLKWRIFYD